MLLGVIRDPPFLRKRGSLPKGSHQLGTIWVTGMWLEAVPNYVTRRDRSILQDLHSYPRPWRQLDKTASVLQAIGKTFDGSPSTSEAIVNNFQKYIREIIEEKDN
jgi:hypothetical protein